MSLRQIAELRGIISCPAQVCARHVSPLFEWSGTSWILCIPLTVATSIPPATYRTHPPAAPYPFIRGPFQATCIHHTMPRSNGPANRSPSHARPTCHLLKRSRPASERPPPLLCDGFLVVVALFLHTDSRCIISNPAFVCLLPFRIFVEIPCIVPPNHFSTNHTDSVCYTPTKNRGESTGSACCCKGGKDGRSLPFWFLLLLSFAFFFLEKCCIC